MNNFSPCNNSNVMAFSQVFIPTLYSIVFILGFFGNGLVVCVLVKHRQHFNMTDICLLNLAVSDLMFLFSLPFWAHEAAATGKWTFGPFMCHAAAALYTLGLYGSIFFMVLMTLDRYALIVHAQDMLISNQRLFTTGTALTLLMWALSLGASLPNMIFTKVPNECGHNESQKCICLLDVPSETAWKPFLYIEMNVLSWLLPLSVMAFCYSHIIPILRSMKSQRRHKAVMLILIIVSVFFVFWTPYNVVIFMHFLQQLGYMDSCEWHQDLHMAMQWVETIAFTHCCLNPIIYAFVGQKFRNLVLRMLRRWFPFCFGVGRQNVTTSQRDGTRSTPGFDVYTTNIL